MQIEIRQWFRLVYRGSRGFSLLGNLRSGGDCALLCVAVTSALEANEQGVTHTQYRERVDVNGDFAGRPISPCVGVRLWKQADVY